VGNGTLRRFFQELGRPDASSPAVGKRPRRAADCGVGLGGRFREGVAHRIPGRRNRIRSGPRLGSLLERRQRGDLRAPADVRLSRATREARAADRGGDARGLRWRPHVPAALEARHLFRARSGIQGKETRARRRRLRLLVQALRRSGEPRTLRVHDPGADRGTGRRDRAGEEEREVRLRRDDSRHGRARQVHDPLQAHEGRLPLSLHARARAVRRRRARGRRGLWQRRAGASGGYRAVHAAGVAARRAHRAGRESQLSQHDLGFHVDRSRGQGHHRRDEGQDDSADPPRRDLRDRGKPVAMALVPAQGARLPVGSADVHRSGARCREQPAADVDEGGRVAISRDRSQRDLHVLQFPRSDDRRILEGENRAAPRDHHGLRHRRRDPRHREEPGSPGADADSLRRRRLRSAVSQRQPAPRRSTANTASSGSDRWTRSASASCSSPASSPTR